MQRSSGRVRMRWVGAVAGRQRPDRRGRLLRGRRGGLARCSRSRRSSLRHQRSRVQVVRACVRAMRIGALGVAVTTAGGPQAAVTAWGERAHRSPSRPQRVERPEWPYRRHLRGKGCMKAAERGGNGVRAASKAWEQAHRHLCVNACCLHDLGRRPSLCRMKNCSFPSREMTGVRVGVERGLKSGI